MAIIKLVFKILLFEFIDFVVIVKLVSFHFIFTLVISSILVVSAVVIVLAHWILILFWLCFQALLDHLHRCVILVLVLGCS